MKARSDIGPFAIVPNWVVDRVKNPAVLKVYCILSRHANDQGDAWPSNERIAEMCQCSEQTVRRALKDLEAIGAIKVCKRLREDGSQTSNLITIMFAYPSEVSQMEPPPSKNGTPPPSTSGTPKNYNQKELKENPYNPHSGGAVGDHAQDEIGMARPKRGRKPKCLDNPEDDDPAWLAFVRAYPKRSGAMKRPDARRVWKILAEHEDVMQIVERAEDYARHIRHVQKEGTQYVMQMTTFLNGEWRQDWNASLPYDLQRIETPDGRTMIRKDYDRECAIR